MKAGDIVYLKSGSPSLTVELARDGLVHVMWYFHGEIRKQVFPQLCLTEERPTEVVADA